MASGYSNALRIFAHIARRMRANRVEERSRAMLQSGWAFCRSVRICPPSICFCHKGFAVCRSGSFHVWNFGLIAINGSGGAKNKVLTLAARMALIRRRVPLTLLSNIPAVFVPIRRRLSARRSGSGVDSVIVQYLGHQRFVTNIASTNVGCLPPKRSITGSTLRYCYRGYQE